MSGTAVIRYLLANDAGVTAVVPATRIYGGDTPIEVALPALIVTQISGVPMNLIRNAGHRQAWTDRIQVSALGKTFPAVYQLIGLIRIACRSQKGTVNGVALIDIAPDFVGPDAVDESLTLYSKSIDFMVRWSAPTS